MYAIDIKWETRSVVPQDVHQVISASRHVVVAQATVHQVVDHPQDDQQDVVCHHDDPVGPHVVAQATLSRFK